MKLKNNQLKSKIASGLKFFITGEDEPLNKKKATSPARELSLAELDMVAGGGVAMAEEHLRELYRKYGVNNRFDALALASEEELIHHIELFQS